ncbi:MAG TPA: helix-turn-helix domain-containing protein [Saprospiraceae bacterium]|mgnify:CR=1 FL=1|nr:helix-turn-helix domain-containing protein [Saprospiraceae bacterium]
MVFSGATQEYLLLETVAAHNAHLLTDRVPDGLTLLWNTAGTTRLLVDDVPCAVQEHQILFLTELHRVEVLEVGVARLVRFNRAFYCIIDHDSEVSCKGILFFGASEVPMVEIPAAEVEKFDILWQMFSMEMQSHDQLQIEMLQMMLKRLLILCMRLYRDERHLKALKTNQLDLVREFNFLVEKHFKTQHNVADYADMLYKSPKTLANYFARYNQQTPLQIIQNRILLEARRLLHYTEQPVKEIAYELGFEDIQSFSRFFRNKAGHSPSDYREQSRLSAPGKIDYPTGNQA